MTKSPAKRRGLRRTRRSLISGDTVFLSIVFAAGLAIIGIIVYAAFVLYQRGELAVSTLGISFLWGTEWNPVTREFGALPFLVGTLTVSFASLAIAVPFAVAAALFVSEYAPRWLAGPVSYLVEALAAIPSVVYGFWGVFVLAPLVRDLQIWILQTPALAQIPLLQAPPSGRGLFTAVVILTIMIIPFTAAVARDIIRLVPRDQREAMYALGATRWEVMWWAVLPYAWAGIMGGVVLSLGRALGETLATTMVIGNRTDFASSIFSPTATMTTIIANEFREAVGAMHVSALIFIGLVLFLTSFIVNVGARLLIRRLAPQGVES